jgi:tRNA nucleotidyltransferase (CCA-adding enzyme)
VAPTREIDPGLLPERLDALEGIAELREAARGQPVYLVGGAVRDLLLGKERTDLDLAVDGEIAPLANALGGELIEHERFSTGGVSAGELYVDIARTRRESYPSPGALPEVSPAPLEQDLARRDFTINAMAVPLEGEPELIDPHGGLDDLRGGVLRILHPDSFVDDPTRALRAARYVARLELALDPDTEPALLLADMAAVSEDRVTAELARIAGEERPSAALKLVAEWGVLDLGSGARLAEAVETLFERQPEWAEFADRETAILLAVAPGDHPSRLRGRATKLARVSTGSPAQRWHLADGHPPPVLALARAADAEWIDDYVTRLRHVELEIWGYDLLEAGIPEGPEIGRGLDAALNARLNGEVSNRDEELRVALEAARGS